MIVLYYAISVLGLLPPRKIASNPQTNPMRNPNPNWGVIFLGRGGDNCTDTCSFIGCLTYLSIFYFNLGVNMTTKKNKIKNIIKKTNAALHKNETLH